MQSTPNIPGGWGERAITVAGRTYQLVVPKDPDEFVYDAQRRDVQQANSERGAGESCIDDIYWAQIWSAAEVMAELVGRRDWSSFRNAIELGCGIGLVGLVAAGAGLHVTFSDYVSLAVDVAVQNAKRNNLEHVEGVVFDWQNPIEKTFDVILASDVLYYIASHAALIRAIDQLLGRDGICWIGDAGREPSIRFLDRIPRHFEVKLFDSSGQPLAQARFGKFFMLEITRR